MNNKEWYIIYTSGIGSRGLQQVQSLLDRMEYEGMLWAPTQKSTITRYGKQQNTAKPLFPSYIFLNTVIDDSKLEQALMEAKIGRFLKHPGDDLPAKISDRDIDYVKSLEETNVEAVPQEIITVEKGNLVEVCVGPFMGIKGIVDKVVGHDVYVETLVFGRSAPVRFNVAHLSKLLDSYEEEKQKVNREVEKANAEIETPKNIDFVEISMPHEELDKVAQKHANLLSQRNDPILRKHTVRRQEKLLRKIFKTASQVLTDDAFQIFTLRYIYQIPEKEISGQLGKHQSYIPRVLKRSIKKIQKKLRIPFNLEGFARDRKIKED